MCHEREINNHHGVSENTGSNLAGLTFLKRVSVNSDVGRGMRLCSVAAVMNCHKRCSLK